MKQTKERCRKNLIPIVSLIFIFLIVLIGAVDIPSTAFYESFLDQTPMAEKTIREMNSYGYFEYAQSVELPIGINNLQPFLEIVNNRKLFNRLNL